MILARGLTLLPALLLPGAAEVAPVFIETFDKPDSAGRVALLQSANVAIVDRQGVGRTRALRVRYVGTDYGSERIAAGARVLPPAPAYTLTYDVRFDRDFAFVRGGKLHGLGPRRSVTGGEPGRPDGWSARVMWRERGRAETYVYHQDQSGRYGDAGTALGTLRFRPGRYHAVSLYVRVNQPAQAANGIVRLRIDGQLVEDRRDLRLRATDSPDSLISTLLFSTFHGGNDASWAPRDRQGRLATVHACFDNVAVWPGEHRHDRVGS